MKSKKKTSSNSLNMSVEPIINDDSIVIDDVVHLLQCDPIMGVNGQPMFGFILQHGDIKHQIYIKNDNTFKLSDGTIANHIKILLK